MRITRQISWFDKATERLVGELNIDALDLDVLMSLFTPPSDDPLMYNPYTIKKKQAIKLEKMLPITFDLNIYIYQVDCFQLP